MIGIGIVDDCALAPQTPAENVAQWRLKPLSCTLVESIRRTQSADLSPISPLQLHHQRRKQAREYLHGREELAVESVDLDTVQPPR